MSIIPSYARRENLNAVAEEKPGFIRELGAQERLFHYYSAEHPRHFCVVAELAANKDPEDYRAAFAMIQRRHPILSVSVRDDSRHGAGFYRTNRPLKLTFIPFAEEADWRRVVERELATAFPDSDGPLMRVTILHDDGLHDVEFHGAGRATVVLTLHHGAADALSGAYIIQDLMEALNGRPLPPLPVMPPLETIAARRLLNADAIAPAPHAEKDAAALRAIADAPLWRPFEGDRPIVSTLAFDRTFTARALHCARENGTTLHGTICAALICSTAADVGKDTFTITSAVDLRAMLDVDQRNCALLVGAGTVRFPLRDRRLTGSAFWKLARQATADLAPARTPEGVVRGLGALEAKLPPATADSKLASGTMGSLQYDAIVSNLGALPIPTTVGSVRLEAFWGPSVQGRFTNERVIGAASLDGQLRIVQTTPSHIPSFLDDLQRILVEACADDE
ncbi:MULTISPECIES: hypothetical protein [unclassified Sinorhizobium]|uniref:phthiocerol/phthiodiolone dimycocerosyl transferase family protein n=1 Tax=unclassified Sinorhizobium TaxID=2613772 RepID=UPI0035264604